MTIPDHELTPADPNGSRLRIPPIRWPTVVVLLLMSGLAFQSWMVWANVEEWRANRIARTAISARVAGQEKKYDENSARMLNELKLQTLNQMLPPPDQQRMLPMLLSRLDEETRRSVLSLKLRALQVIGEQQGAFIEDLRPERRGTR